MSSPTFALLPRDGMFFKDARGWHTSDVGKSHAHPWPLPPTLRGALRAAYGQAWMDANNKTLSPTDWEQHTEGVAIHRLLTLRRPIGQNAFTTNHRLWPVPADARYVEGQPTILSPQPPKYSALGNLSDSAYNKLWWPYSDMSKKSERSPMFWSDQTMMQWLLGIAPHDKVPGHSPTCRDDIHVTINAQSQSAEPARLFSSRVIEPFDSSRHEWAIGLQCSFPDGSPWTLPHLIPLGGRRRPALAKPIEAVLFDAPPLNEFKGAKGLRLILTTPAQFDKGWLPDGFRDEEGIYQGTCLGMKLILKAAMVARPLYLSTWDMAAKRPRKTRSLVPAGAVYFFVKQNGEDFSPQDFRNAWLASIGKANNEGLGLVLPGIWNASTETSTR